MSLKRAIALYLLLWLVLVVGGYGFTGGSTLFDQQTLGLAGGLGLLLLVALKMNPPALLPQVGTLSIFVGIYFLPRIALYLFAPHLAQFPFDAELDAAAVNSGLRYILLGTLAILVGLFGIQAAAPGTRSARSRTSLDTPPLSTATLVVLFLIWLAWEAYLHFILKLNVFSGFDPGRSHPLGMILRVLIGIDAAFFLVFGIILAKARKTRADQIALLGFLAVYTLYLTLSGSRGAVVRVAFMTLILLMVQYGNFRLKFRVWLTGAAIAVLLGPLAFFLGHGLRLQQMTTRDAPVIEMVKASLARDIELSRSFGMILDRLGLVDYPISVVSREETRLDTHYLHLSYTAKSIVNILLPGTVYPDADIPVSRVQSILYRGYDEERVRRDFNTEYWTSWGIAYAHFGEIGGLGFLLLSAAVLHLTYLVIAPRSPYLRFVLRSWFIFTVMVAGYYGNMGLDHAFTTVLFLWIQMFLLYLAAAAIEQFLRIGRVRRFGTARPAVAVSSDA